MRIHFLISASGVKRQKKEFKENKEAYIAQTPESLSQSYIDNHQRREQVDSKYSQYVKLWLDYLINQEQYRKGGIEDMYNYKNIVDFEILDKEPLDEESIEYMSEFVEIGDVSLELKNYIANVCGQNYVGLFNGGADVVNVFKDKDKHEIIFFVEWT